MKIIDLLQRIANGEEVPKKIRIRGVFYQDFDKNGKPIDAEDRTIWYLDDSYFGYDYYSEGKIGEKNLFETYLTNRILNNEVEILEEEKKIPEKLNKQMFHKKQRQLANKINEIIDFLKQN